MTTNEPSAPKTPPAAGVLPFEADRYRAHVEDFEMTEEQKDAFLRTLWDIMAAFVRLGFDVDTVLPHFKEASESAPDALEQTIPTHEFNVAVDDGASNKED